MKITKFGHCCLLIEEGDLRLLTDPGDYNKTPDVENLDAILVTHEHGDHLHLDALRKILEKNPTAQVITHQSVGKILFDANLPYTLISDKEEIILKDIKIESFGTEHACVHPDLPTVQNTGFLIAEKLFYPGDSFHQPGKLVRFLALPVAGPWMKLSEAIEYAKALKPEAVFPIHDGMLRQEHQLGPTRRIPELLLSPLDIKYVDAVEGSIIVLE